MDAEIAALDAPRQDPRPQAGHDAGTADRKNEIGMSTVGQIEKKTQQRVVKLFRDKLGYDYLGDWTDRAGNANIEAELLRAWLKKQGYDEALISRALHDARQGGRRHEQEPL